MAVDASRKCAANQATLCALAQVYRLFFKVLYSPVVYDRFLYDLTIHIAFQIKSLVEGALVLAQGRDNSLQTGLAMTAVGRMEQSDLADFAELLEQGVERAWQAMAAQVALQQTGQQQRQHAAEHVDLDLLIGPVVLGAQGDAVRPLHLAEGAFDVVLGAIAAHDVGVAPVVVVGEQERLAEQGRLQVLPSRLVEVVGERRKVVLLSDLDREEVAHVAGAQPAVDFPGHALEAGRAAA